MKYSYEFTFDDNGSISIRRWNLFKTEQLEIWKFLSVCDDWSDIFYCRVFLSKRRVIIYNEKFFPSEEDNWLRYEKQNNLFSLYSHYTAVALQASDSDVSGAEGYPSF